MVVQRFVYASSSSVYGNREDTPFGEDDRVDKPLSIYAASKKANELVAHTYSHLYNLPTVGLRFFTVYGPWGRPDMAPSIFALNMLKDKAITVFNQGDMLRDFTFVDDIVEGVWRVIQGGSNNEIYQIYNIGNSNPTVLHDFISTLEDVLGKKAKVNYKEMRAGDVLKTYSDVSRLQQDYDYRPTTSLRTGIEAFVQWMRAYYHL
jgi:UDP-glucuronate 4-epimerase